MIPKQLYREPTATIETSWHCVIFKLPMFNLYRIRPRVGTNCHKMFAWCEENCMGRWSYIEYKTHARFYFKTASDSATFKLTWVEL